MIIFFNKIDVLEEKVTSGKKFGTFVDSLDSSCKYQDIFQDYNTFDKPKGNTILVNVQLSNIPVRKKEKPAF